MRNIPHICYLYKDKVSPTHIYIDLEIWINGNWQERQWGSTEIKSPISINCAVFGGAIVDVQSGVKKVLVKKRQVERKNIVFIWPFTTQGFAVATENRKKLKYSLPIVIGQTRKSLSILDIMPRYLCKWHDMAWGDQEI